MLVSPHTGIDKLGLFTPDFLIKDSQSESFGQDRSIKQGGRVPKRLLTDSNGVDVDAWKLYHNSEKGGGNYTISDRGLLISFNPSKMFHPYKLVGMSGVMQGVETIQKEMQEIGILTNLMESKVCRLDIACQKEMTYPLFQYESAYRLLKGQRIKNQRQYEGGYMFSNNSTQTQFYNKQLELQKDGLDVLENENNLLRGEIRLLKREPVKSQIGIVSLYDLINTDQSFIDDKYKTYLNKRIFSRQYISDQLELDFYGEVEILKELKQTNPRGAWQQYLMESNIEMTLLKFGNISKFGEMLAMAGYKRMQVYRIKAEVSKIMQRKGRNDKKRGEVSTGLLLNEIQEKFAA
ncbi:MAG: phage/plasmid replication protein [Bacteroidota bacterium]|jgi:hypothetical protein